MPSAAGPPPLAERRMSQPASSRDFETQHKLLLLETLYDAGLSLGALPSEDALVEDVLGRAVGVLDASRGYLATFEEGGARRAEARVGFPRRPAEAVVAEDPFLRDVLHSDAALRREHFRLLRTGVSTAIGVSIRAGGRAVGALVLADKEMRRGGKTAFEEEDVRFLTSLAGLCGMAIENRRHLEQLANGVFSHRLHDGARDRSVLRAPRPHETSRAQGLRLVDDAVDLAGCAEDEARLDRLDGGAEASGDRNRVVASEGLAEIRLKTPMPLSGPPFTGR